MFLQGAPSVLALSFVFRFQSTALLSRCYAHSAIFAAAQAELDRQQKWSNKCQQKIVPDLKAHPVELQQPPNLPIMYQVIT